MGREPTTGYAQANGVSMYWESRGTPRCTRSTRA